MPTVIECPACQRRLSVPEELLSEAVQCANCGRTFAVGEKKGSDPLEASQGSKCSRGSDPFFSEGAEILTAPVRGLPPPPEPLRPVPISGGTAPLVPGVDGGRICSECGANLPPATTRCPWCDPADGQWEERPWEGPEPTWVRRDCEPHRGTLILVLGILGLVTVGIYFLSPIGLGLSVTAWVMGQRDLRRMREKVMDPQGLSQTQAGRICGIVGAVLNLLWVLGCGAFFLLMVWLQ